MSMSRREKVLVLAAVYIGLFYLAFQFGIMSMYKAYNDKLSNRDSLSERKTQIEMRIAQEQIIKGTNAEQHAVLDAIREDYPALQRNEQIDKVLTSLCVSHGLEPTRLNLSDSAVPVPLLDLVTENGTEERTAENFVVMSVQMMVNGSVDQLLRLIDEVEGIENIRISRLSFNSSVGLEPSEPRSVTISFEFTMFNEF